MVLGTPGFFHRVLISGMLTPEPASTKICCLLSTDDHESSPSSSSGPQPVTAKTFSCSLWTLSRISKSFLGPLSEHISGWTLLITVVLLVGFLLFSEHSERWHLFICTYSVFIRDSGISLRELHRISKESNIKAFFVSPVFVFFFGRVAASWIPMYKQRRWATEKINKLLLPPCC